MYEQKIALSVPRANRLPGTRAGADPSPELTAQKQAQLQDSPTLAAAIMEKTLAMLPAPNKGGVGMPTPTA